MARILVDRRRRLIDLSALADAAPAATEPSRSARDKRSSPSPTPFLPSVSFQSVRPRLSGRMRCPEIRSGVSRECAAAVVQRKGLSDSRAAPRRIAATSRTGRRTSDSTEPQTVPCLQAVARGTRAATTAG